MPDGTSKTSLALGVSADGETVVGRSNGAQGNEAFVWNATEGMIGLGDLPGGTFQSIARGVSSDGQTVVGDGRGAQGTEAFVWTAAGGMVGLGDLSGGTFDSQAWAVSSDGGTVVGNGRGADGTEAFVWTSAEGMVGLGTLSEGDGATSQAFGVSADGSRVVGASGSQAFMWTSSGGMVPLPGAVAAYGVSADGGTVVGYRGIGVNNAEAFAWTPEGGIVGLGDLPGGRVESVAYDVSADGETVVGYSHGDNGSRPFIWTSAEGMRPVREALEDLGLGPMLAGWTLFDAQAVSDDGQTIVGFGRNPRGFHEAWVAHLDATPIPGGADYNNDGFISQGDLDLVLLNWGADTSVTGVPAGWINNPPTGVIGQAELDAVLLDWGGSAEADASPIPEPAAVVLMGGWLGVTFRRRR